MRVKPTMEETVAQEILPITKAITGCLTAI